MMVRVVARLDIKGPSLVKGIHLEGLRVLGPPNRFARHYDQSGADELIYMDAVASLYGRNIQLDIIEATASEIFIPLIVGGGLRSIDDLLAVLRVGADRVALNTAAIERPELIREAAEKFGSSTITVSIDAKRASGAYYAYTNNGRKNSGREAVAWACEAAALGAGEILITSIDRDGTGSGFDIALVREIVDAVAIPVTACGGAGCAEHVVEVIADGHADAVSVASMLHYLYARELVASGINLASAGDFRIISEKIDHDRITGATLSEIKTSLSAAGIPCRPADESYVG